MSRKIRVRPARTERQPLRAGSHVLVADPETSTGDVLVKALSRVGLVATVTRTGEEALELVRQERPAVVVLDIALPDLSGYEICHQLRTEYGPALPIIFLSAERTEARDKIAGLLLGADDYIVKPFDIGELVSRIQRFAERQATAAFGVQPLPREAEVRLTPSERRILQLLAHGYGTKQIAQVLSIAPKTVGTHISNVMKKFDVESRTQAVVAAQRLGLVDLGDKEVESHSSSASGSSVWPLIVGGEAEASEPAPSRSSATVG